MQSKKEKAVADFIFRRQEAGASIQKVAANMKITHQNAKHIFSRLIKSGEIFRKNNKGIYCSTAWFMQFDTTSVVEQLHDNLKRDLFGNKLSPELRSFLTAFSSGVKMGLGVDESFLFAKDRMEKPRRRLGAIPTPPMEAV